MRKDIFGDMFQEVWTGEFCTLCITTNGDWDRFGRAVAGRGCAKAISEREPGFKKALGTILKNRNPTKRETLRGINNVPTIVLSKTSNRSYNIVNFPVKPRKTIAKSDRSNIVKHMRGQAQPGEIFYGWASVADPDIIVESAHQLVELADRHGWKNVLLPRPGCGAGELKWESIRPLLNSILDERFVCIHKVR